MQMMYETIYMALKEVGLDDTYEPQDYLNFFCLGNREASDLNHFSDGSPKSANTPQVRPHNFKEYSLLSVIFLLVFFIFCC